MTMQPSITDPIPRIYPYASAAVGAPREDGPALAWRASMQITGRPSRLSSVHSHVVVGPVSMPIRTVPGALDLTNKAIASGSIRPRPLARSIPSGSPRRSMCALTTRPVQHNIPLPLSIVARPHEAGLIRSWRADSLCLCLARSRNYPMLQNSH